MPHSREDKTGYRVWIWLTGGRAARARELTLKTFSVAAHAFGALRRPVQMVSAEAPAES